MLRRLLRTDRKTNRARVLARLAGVPAGLRQTRRGSFLIMVVGTLALLSVITVIYVSIGRSDRQTSAAVLKYDQRRDAPTEVRDYLAGVIADDLFDYYYGGERDQNGDPIFRREAWDYPSTAYTAVLPDGNTDTVPTPITVGDGNDARFHFTPTGNGTGTDPWLASSEPVLLDFQGNSAYLGSTGPTNYFRERLDWMNLSNFAPDGSFVNLWNLRDKGFDATPWDMRDELTVFEDTPTAGQRGDQLDFGATAQVAINADETRRPAEWTGRQTWAVWPVVEPKFKPNDSRYLLYQYADADGDGIIDARWTELVEDRDENDNVAARYILAPDDRMRYFVAARAIDLSGRVNVNTATDSSLAPDANDPFGMTPSAIDIRRLLDGEDFFTDQRTDWDNASGNGYGLGYTWMVQPNHPNAPDDTDPSTYVEYFTDAGGGGPYNGYYAGEKAYDALRTVLDTGLMPGAGYDGLSILAGGGSVDREFSVALGGGFNPYWQSYWKTGGAFSPTDFYTLFAGFGAEGGGNSSGGTLESGLGRAFGDDSLLELLTRNGVNDDRTRSALEVVLGGRADYGLMAPELAARFSPLRDNRRTADVEMLRGRWRGKSYEFFDEAKAGLFMDIRQRLTTVSFARPIEASLLQADTSSGPEFEPLAGDLPLTNADTRDSIGTLFASAQNLYKFYADALAPYSAHQQSSTLGDHWNPADSRYDEFRTLYYGYSGPQLALRTAAHLAVNMKDAYDNGDQPTKRTVLLNGSDAFRNPNNLYSNDPARDRPVEYPWKLLDLDEGAVGQDSRLYRTDPLPAPAMPDAINVFGIEAQPFLVEAASFVLYTDTPNSAGGDKDFSDPPNNGQIERLFPSINGRVPGIGPGLDNPDFLFEVLAFQIHNPFDESITLSGTGSNIAEAQQDLYYIQYGTQFFKLTNVSNGAEEPITIGRGESKTVYALSQHPDVIGRRIFRITKGADYGNHLADGVEFEQTRVRNWLKHQLGLDAVQIAPFEPTTGAVDLPSDVAVLWQTENLQQGSRDERKIVRLWRVEKPTLDLENGGINITGVDESIMNLQANDTLVDRMRDVVPTGERPTLDRRLWEAGDSDQDDQAGRIRQASPGKEPSSKDNQGLSISRYSVLRRNGDTQAGEFSTPPRGGLPAYCVELKDQFDGLGGLAPGANDNDDDGSDPKRLSRSDFDGKEGEKQLDDLLRKQSDLGNLSSFLLPTIFANPAKKADYLMDIEEMPPNLANVPFEGDLAFGGSNPPMYVETHLDNDEFEDPNGVSVMRVADLLLPLGIGPHQIPLINGITPPENIQWTTLSEALAIALYYEDDTSDPTNVYAGAFDPPASTAEPDRVLLDRGQLRYDWFVPFVDTSADGLFDPGEPVWGLGVPMAATLLDRVSTLDRKFASLYAPTQGILNVNTASRETLRSLPALSPPRNDNQADGTGNWWWPTTGALHDWRSDIATTLTGYRDRVSIFTRDVDGTQPAEPIDFRLWYNDPRDPWVDPRSVARTSTAPGEDEFDNSRWGAVGVPGIQERPGLRSLGEISLMRYWDTDFLGAGAYASPHDIDRLGYDGDNISNSGAEGVDSVVYDFDNNGTPDDDEIDDDFDERLTLANAVISSSSVRSDVFAVWFLVHGYQESDVSKLGDDDPLVPSLARRFVMVVDRSNVTKPGEKPRILLFKEVPL